jgi:hypothetical protein
MSNCFLCSTPDTEEESERNPYKIRVDCPTCGRYVITVQVVANGLLEQFKDKKHILSALVRQSSDQGSHLAITTENFKQILDSAPVIYSPLGSFASLYYEKTTKS